MSHPRVLHCVPAKPVREKRALIKYRQRLVKYRTSIQLAIRALFSAQGITSVPRGTSAWTQEGLGWLRKHARPLEEISDVEQLWRGRLHVELETFEAVSKALKKVEDKLNKLGSADARIRRLQTIPGVGPRLAETVAAFSDDPNRFRNCKHVGSYVGLTPRQYHVGLTPKQYQSGQMERQGRISGRGNKLLRNARPEEWVSSHSLMGRRLETNRIHCDNPNRGTNQSGQTRYLTSLAS